MKVRQLSYPKIFPTLGLATGLLLGLSAGAWAQTKTWIQTTTAANFTSGTSWSPAGAPSTSDVITTNLTSPGNLQITADTTVAGIVQNLSTGSWIINESAGGTLAFNVTGTIAKSNGDSLTIKRSSPNLLNMTIGELNVSGGSMIFGAGHGSDLFNLSATTTKVSGGNLAIDVAHDYSLGDLNVSAGTVAFSTDNQDPNGQTGQTVTVTSLVGTGGTIQGVTTTGISGGANPVTLAVNQATNTTVSTVLTNGNIGTANNLSLIKSGTGSLTLTANNTYTGTTVVSAGTLLINGSNTASAVTSGSGATLGGSGTIGAITVQGGGLVAPGNASAILTSSRATFSSSNSVLGVGVASTGVSGAVSLAGSHYDQMVLTGTSAGAETVLTLTNSTLKLTLSGSPVALDKYFIVVLQDALDSSTGAFAWATDGVSTVAISGGAFTLDGQAYSIGYNGDSTTNSLTGGNDVVIQAVPEPGTIWLLGIGTGLLAVRSWRGRSRRVIEAARY